MNNISSINKFNSKSQNDDFHKQDISFDINKLQDACNEILAMKGFCLLYTSPSPRDKRQSRMPSSA